jgi:hypothetical protein
LRALAAAATSKSELLQPWKYIHAEAIPDVKMCNIFFRYDKKAAKLEDRIKERQRLAQESLQKKIHKVFSRCFIHQRFDKT